MFGFLSPLGSVFNRVAVVSHFKSCDSLFDFVCTSDQSWVPLVLFRFVDKKTHPESMSGREPGIGVVVISKE